MSKLFKWILMAGLLTVFHPLWLPFFSKILLVPDQNTKADCAVVLRGDDYFRLRKAAELLKSGQVRWIVTSLTPADADPYDLDRKVFGLEGVSPEEMLKKYFRFYGADLERVIVTDRETTSTFEEAVQARLLLQRRGMRSLILVTSGYHMRRALWIFKYVFKGTGIEVYPVTAPDERFQPSTWWKKERDVRAVEAEYGSFVFNFFYHVLFCKSSTSFDTV